MLKTFFLCAMKMSKEAEQTNGYLALIVLCDETNKSHLISRKQCTCGTKEQLSRSAQNIVLFQVGEKLHGPRSELANETSF